MQAIPKIGFALMIAAAWAACGTAAAQGPGMMGMAGHHMGPGMMDMPGHHMRPGMMQGQREARLQALGLSEEQRAGVDRIREETRRKNWDALGQIRSERYKLRELFRAETVDPAAVVDQKRKVDDLRRQVLRARLEARNQILALLTPEQRQIARSFKAQRWGRGAGR